MRSKPSSLSRIDERHFRFDVNNSSYLARPLDLDLATLPSRPGPCLVTVFAAQGEDLCVDEWLNSKLTDYQTVEDDVWTFDFLEGLLIITSDPNTTSPSAGLLADMRRRSSWHALISGIDLPVGPYVFINDRLNQVYRLLDDDKGAFVVPVEPSSSPNCIFEPLNLAGNFPQSLAVAVPSRIPTISTKNLPLQGKRFAVKELFELRGLRMALSNRAFYACSSKSDATAPAIKDLLAAGAVMLGSTKCSSMISREDPIEAIDFQAPFNPRGDGYQSPVGSSSGSAAAIASYDWLDFAVGSDTTGSSRRPAFVNGCFQIRFSHEAFSLEGVRPCFSRFDAPALFARDLGSLENLTRIWCGPKLNHPVQKPTVVVYPLDFFPVANKEQQKLLMALVEDIAKHCEISIKTVSIKDLWCQTAPACAAGKALETFLEGVGRNSFIYDFYHASDEFRESYEKSYNREPYVNKVTRWRWDLGSQITRAQRDDAIRRMDVYKEWLLEEVLQHQKEVPIVVLPVQNAEPNYRDTDPGPPFAQDVWDPLWLSPVLGAPEITVPVGEVTYRSRISRRIEHLPVAVSFMSPPGTDVMLASALKSSFIDALRPLSVKTGSNLYE